MLIPEIRRLYAALGIMATSLICAAACRVLF